MRATCGSGVALVREFEGLHRVVKRNPVVTVAPYVCPAGYWTIGYGHLCAKDHPEITEAQAEAYLPQDMGVAEHGVIASCPIWPVLTDGQFAALVSFVFNLGVGSFRASTLRRRVNAREFHDVPYQFSRWVYAGKAQQAGLIRRRRAEIRLWTS